MDHPFNTSTANEKLPYTNTGMTGAKSNIIPEYYCSDRVDFHSGDITTIYSNDGKVIGTYKCIDNGLTNENRSWKWIKL